MHPSIHQYSSISPGVLVEIDTQDDNLRVSAEPSPAHTQSGGSFGEGESWGRFGTSFGTYSQFSEN
jgi:hypothetical protein